jgi:hypothetical protein
MTYLFTFYVANWKVDLEDIQKAVAQDTGALGKYRTWQPSQLRD